MTHDPLPCPFCGSNDVHVNGIGQQVVRCMKCRCEGPAICAAAPEIQARLNRISPAETWIQALRRFAIEAWNAAPRPTFLQTITCGECGDQVSVEACQCERAAEEAAA
jgi:hypothetical protein